MLRDLQEHAAAVINSAARTRRGIDAAVRAGDERRAEWMKSAGASLFLRAEFYGAQVPGTLLLNETGGGDPGTALAFLIDRLDNIYETAGDIQAPGAAVLIDEAGTALRLLVQGAAADA